MNTNLIVTSSVAQACAHVTAPAGAGFEGRGVSASGMSVIERHLPQVIGTDLPPTWRNRPTTDRYIRLRAPQV